MPNTIPAAGKAVPKQDLAHEGGAAMTLVADFDPSDIFYSLLDLAELMQATYDIINEMEYVRPDGSRNDDLDRVAALQRIACRDIKRLRDAAEIFDGPRRWVQVVGERERDR